MACFQPSLAVDLCQVDGKHKIKFIPRRVDQDILSLRRSYGDSLLLLPCGKCLGCKCDKAKDWATRCYCESLYHNESCFVTLTYDGDHVTDQLCKEDINDFIQKLWNRDISFKFFGCGEYGSLNKRPHWHLILFGFKPHDLVFHSRGSKGDFLYDSSFLKSLWNRGFVIVGDLSFESAGYVARYTTKKASDDDSFLFMSKGIGKQYCLDHIDDLLMNGRIFGDFGDLDYAPIPTYFEKILREIRPKEFELYKNRKLNQSKLNDTGWQHFLKFGHLEEVKFYRANIAEQKLKRLERM